MENKYDTILKEKKKYTEVVDDRHFLRKHALLIDTLIIIIILLVSLTIYIKEILKPSQIIIDDIVDFKNDISVLYQNLLINYNFENNYNLTGNVSFNIESNYENESTNFLKDLKLEYMINQDNNNNLINITSDKYNLNYYHKNDNTYIEYGNNYIDYSNINKTYNIEDYKYTYNLFIKLLTEELNKINFKKNITISLDKQIVYISTNLTGKEINKMLDNVINKLKEDKRSNEVLNTINLSNYKLEEDANINLEIRNDLFKNNLLEMKLVINNNNYRGVLTYKNNKFEYSDAKREYRIEYKKDNQDMIIRVYNYNELKYVIAGKGTEGRYSYTFQEINKINNLNFQITKEDNKNNYELIIKKESEPNTLTLAINLELNYNKNISTIEKELTKNYSNYLEKSKEEQEEINDYFNKIYISIKEVLKSVNFM